MNFASPYVLASGLGLEHGVVPIPAEQAIAIAQATARITDVLYAEQKFDILVENYVEVENALLRLGVHHMVHETLRAQFFELQRDLFNRLLSNLLSAARAYLDFMPQAAGRMLAATPRAVERCTAAKSVAYDTYLGYRVMEGLRNFAQHEGLPVQALRFTGDKIGDEVRTVISFYARKDEMREAKVFKIPVQTELDGEEGEGVDLKRMMREYVSGIAKVHQVLREEVQPFLVKWQTTISSAAASFKLLAPQVHENTIGVLHQAGKPPVFTHLPLALWSHLTQLREKNGHVRDLHNQFVSGQLIPEQPGQQPMRPRG